MKKFLAGILALMMIVSLVACGNKTAQTASNETTAQPTTPSKVVLKFAAQGDSTPGTQSAIDAFNKMQDKYEVVWIDMTNDSGAMKEQVLTSMKAGSSDYDVLSMDVCWAGEFAAAGYIEPLDTMMMNAGLKKNMFNAGSMAAGTYNAKTYSLPFFPDLGILYFRKDIVSGDDVAKLESGNYTYADLKDMALKYKGQGGTKDGFAFQGKLGECLVCNLTEYTSGWADVEGGLKSMKEIVDSGCAPKDILNYAEGETCNSFIKGDTVFSRNWPYQYGTLKSEGTVPASNVGIAPLPGGSCVGGWLLGINKNSMNKDGAFEFIKFLSGNEGQKIMSIQGGYLPGFNQTLSDSEVIVKNEMLSFTGFKNALNTTVSRPVSAEYGKCSDIIMNSAHAYLSGTKDLSEATNEITNALK